MAKAATTTKASSSKAKTAEPVEDAPKTMSYRDKLRLRAKQSAARGGGGGEYKKKVVGTFNIEDGQKVSARPLHNTDIAPIIRTHPIKEKNFARALCMSEFDQPCQPCDNDDQQGDVMLLFMFVPEFIGKKGVFDTDKGETKTYDINPIVVFRRTAGKDGIHINYIVDLDEKYQKAGGLMSRFFDVKKQGEGKDTQFTFIADDPEPFELTAKQRKGLTDRQYEAFTKVMTAIEKAYAPKATEEDRVQAQRELLDLAIANFILPPGTDEWPSGEQWVGVDAAIVLDESTVGLLEPTEDDED